jgi:hypothetical protein
MAVLAAIGLATSAVSTIASFAQAAKQQNMMDDANAAAASAIKEARKRLDVNVYDALTVSDTPYERQREMFNAQTQQMMAGFQELGVQGMRGAGVALQQGSQMQEKIADVKTQKLEGIEKIQLDEDARLKDLNTQLDIQEAQGAQLAARDAQEFETGAITQGFEGLTSMGAQAGGMFELYKQDNSTDISGSQKNLAMSLATDSPIPPSNTAFTTLNGDYSNPLAYKKPNLSLTGG